MIPNNEILTSEQILLLDIVSISNIFTTFYLSGGTALVGFYYPYRYSDDLDFFTTEEVDNLSILTFFKKNKARIGYIDFELQILNNRNLFYLNFKNGYQLKLEFTFYPFEQLEKSKKYNNILVDNIKDIAINKLFTIYQSPRTRDFTDLYIILQNKHFTIDELIADAKIKFDWHVDKFQLGKRFRSVFMNLDKQRYVDSFPVENCKSFFLSESKKLGESIFN